jgi:hypothetical protein
MAKAPAPIATAPGFDEAKTYRVALNKVVSVGRLTLYPRDTHELAGKALNGIVAEHGPEVIDDVVAIG